MPWQSLLTVRRPWIVATFVACGMFAGAVSLFSTDSLHRLWGLMAACGYAVAALAVMAWRSRGTDLALVVSLCGALIVPLMWMAWTGQSQPEVSVITRSAGMLVHHGTPYQSPGLLSNTRNPNAYDPYLPAMTLFGLPDVIAAQNPLADPRVWFGLVFVVLFALALWIGQAKDVARWAVFITASPIIALELSVGGDDVPIVALLCLGFALLWRYPRPVLAGLAFGAAAAMKAIAWPAIIVAFSLLVTRDGKRPAAVMTAASLSVAAVIVGPFAVLRPDSLVKNTVLFPLGLASVTSQAVSPLPGHLIAQTGHAGRMFVIAMLVATALGVLASLFLRPPRDVPAAAARLIISLTLMFLLAPATRFGYFIYPAGILAWLIVAAIGQRGGEVEEFLPPPGPAGAMMASRLRPPGSPFVSPSKVGSVRRGHRASSRGADAGNPADVSNPADASKAAEAATTAVGPAVGDDPVTAGGAGPLGTVSAVKTGAVRSVIRRAIHPAVARRRANWQRVPGRLFAVVTVLPSLLVMAWLLAGLPLLLAGRFNNVPVLVISIPLAVALVFFALRQVPASWPHGIRDIWDSRQAGPGSAEVDPAEPGAGGAGQEVQAAAEIGGEGAGTSGDIGTLQPGTTHPDVGQPEAGHPEAAGESRNSERPDVPWWALAGTVAVAAGFAVWQLAMNSQQIIVLRDPGAYLQFGYWIAEHGSTRIPQSLQAFGGVHSGITFASPGFYRAGSTVVPQFMAGLPMLLAIGVWAGGALAAAAMAPVIGGCAVLAFGGLAGRLAGARWAPAAALVLAVCLPEQYASRSTFSETLTQVMLYGGLCMLVDSFVITAGRHGAGPGGTAAQGWPEQARPGRSRRGRWPWAAHMPWAAGRPWATWLGQGGWTGRGTWRDGPSPNATLAFLGGLAMGLTVLIRIDGLNDLLPAIPFLGVLLAAKRVQAVPFGVGLVIGLGYGLADGYLLSLPYLDSVGSSLRLLTAIALGAIVLTVIGMGVMEVPQIRNWLRSKVSARPLRWLPEAAAAVTLLAAIGFAVRPYLQTVRGETDRAATAYVAGLQWLAHLPIDPHRQYYEDSLYWVIWYIGIPAVLLGVLGLALLARRSLRALLTWRDEGAARVWVLPLMIIGWVTVTVLWRPGIFPDQPWASRRLVPVVLPGLILAAVWMSAWLKERGRGLGAGRLAAAAVATCCVIALLVPAAVTTFGIGLTRAASGSHRPTANGLAFKRTGAGEYSAVRSLCAQIGPNASAVILDRVTAEQFSQVLRGMCATPTASIDNPSLASVESVMAGIQRAGRRPVLLAGQESRLAPYGGAPREALNLLTTQDAHELTQPPTGTWPIHFVIWMSQPTGVAGGAVASQEAEYSRRS
ncbi:MAG TPA: glycosyltransferase 87 family protein [Streptosporangiaceae bacterium]|nr:glycosyltransferase 87 family protein [Streptosporangiaceae bacterium]